MTAFLVFNDLSASRMVESVAIAEGCLEEFSNVLVDPRIKGKKVFIASDPFLQLQVAVGFSIGRWLAESRGGDREKRVRVKTLVDRRSRYEDYVPGEEIERQDVEYLCANDVAKGLFVALSLDGLALSVRSSEKWDHPSVDLNKIWIEGDEVYTRVFQIPHCCRSAQLETHVEWLRRRDHVLPEDGSELWIDRLSFFPSLDFCESVEGQLTGLGANDPRFKAILRGLIDLERYCESWESGSFDIHQLANASGESESTLNMYSDERTFRCPDGEYRLFEWHLKRGNMRIHFFDFPAEKRILVGYAGSHLRISST
jgi:hypothetical protein